MTQPQPQPPQCHNDSHREPHNDTASAKAPPRIRHTPTPQPTAHSPHHATVHTTPRHATPRHATPESREQRAPYAQRHTVAQHSTSHHITSHPITSHHITSHHITAQHMPQATAHATGHSTAANGDSIQHSIAAQHCTSLRCAALRRLSSTRLTRPHRHRHHHRHRVVRRASCVVCRAGAVCGGVGAGGERCACGCVRRVKIALTHSLTRRRLSRLVSDSSRTRLGLVSDSSRLGVGEL
jgi:hypothetical protein